jgi:hypothetical protein
MYKLANESTKEEYNILNEAAKKRSGHIAMGKNLLNEDPHTVRIDGIHAKETHTILGNKI